MFPAASTRNVCGTLLTPIARLKTLDPLTPNNPILFHLRKQVPDPMFSDHQWKRPQCSRLFQPASLRMFRESYSTHVYKEHTRLPKTKLPPDLQNPVDLF